MTWCTKIYDIFNGWSDEDNTLSIEPAALRSLPSSAIEAEFYRNDTDENNVTLIQHDSPFLEKSDSSTQANCNSEQLFNPDYLNYRDYRGEHICADTLFSCHQRDGHYYYDADQRPYGIATISNMSLNLVKYMGNIEDKLQQQQQLSRSFSLDLPMDMRRAHFSLPAMNDDSPRVRHSLNEKRIKPEKPSRLSLMNSDRSHRSKSGQNRQDSFGYRVSTRSSYSIPDFDPQDLSHRNNEQITQDVQYHIKEMFDASPNGVFPMIYRLPSNETSSYNDQYRVEGGYGEPSQWITQTKILSNDCRITTDNIASIYSNSFFDQYHHNLYTIDQDSNPIVMSIKPHENKLSVIVRTKEGSKAMDLIDDENHSTDYVYLSQQFYPNLQIDHFENCANFKAHHHIKTFDDKLEIQKFKFAVIYQRRGQTTEEEFFNNERHHSSFDEFLNIIATRVSLKNFKGYRAGLDASEQTDSPMSYYECYDQKEIMFHVSTLLPFTPNDSTQIQRKRHIGNDIVAIVFQEENTPFHPSMIKSNFLHVFLVIQPVQVLSRSCYKMMLIARHDIAEFSPVIYPNIVYVRTAEQLKPFILSKLINAEYAAYRCRTFALLQERTRCSYLKTLCENLSEKSYEILCDEHKRSGHRRLSILSNSSRKHYLSSMKKIFTRSSTLPDGTRQSIKSDPTKKKTSKKLLRLGKSIDIDDTHRSSVAMSSSDHDSTRDNDVIPPHRDGRSDDSVNSNDEQRSSTIHQYSPQPAQVYYGDESDEGLDSMSSAETARAPYDSDDQDAYRQQIRDKSHPPKIWHRLPNQRHISTPQTAGIHISESSTV